MFQHTLLLAWLLVVFAGCSDRSYKSGDSVAASRASDYEYSSGSSGKEKGLIGATPSEEQESSKSSVGATQNRKIIYTASYSLVVTDFAEAEADIRRLVKEHGGYFANVSVNQNQGSRRTGEWQARIPVEQLDAFLGGISQIGIPEKQNQHADDVTEQYVDVEAGIANNKRLEARILTLLENQSDDLKDVMEVERQLARVRGMIEQMEGRLRYLKDRVELTTVTISAREEIDYVPPQTPTFSNRISSSWNDSLDSLQTTGENAAVTIVGAFLWIVLIGVAVVVLYSVIKRRFRPKAVR